MTTNVDKTFEGPSRFSAMFEHARQQSAQTSNSFAGQSKTQDGGRWSAMRNHAIDMANEKANKPAPGPVFRGGMQIN